MTNPKIDGQKVKDIIFHQDGALMLLKRGNEMEVPHGDTYLYLGDTLTIIGSETAIDDFKDKFTLLH